jgi:hypothetical protein
LVPSEPIVEPTRPAVDASLADWHEYYVRKAAALEWQMEVEAWRSGIEGRLEGLEAITDLVPEILERLPAPTISSEHQNKVLRLPAQPCHEPKSRHDLQRALYRLQRPALPVTRLQLNGCRLNAGFEHSWSANSNAFRR